jgi:hypothetical protein
VAANGNAKPCPRKGLCNEKPKAPLIFVEGEKNRDALTPVYPECVVLSWAGGSNATLEKTDWSPVAGRSCVLLCPDADNSGLKAMREVAGILASLGIQNIKILDITKLSAIAPDGSQRPVEPGCDIADALAEGWQPEALREAIAKLAEPFEPAAAEPAGRPTKKTGPLPLFPPIPAGSAFPVDALGELLGATCRAIARKVQVPDAIAAQSVLAAASLAAQAIANVLLLTAKPGHCRCSW